MISFSHAKRHGHTGRAQGAKALGGENMGERMTSKEFAKLTRAEQLKRFEAWAKKKSATAATVTLFEGISR